MVQAKWGDMRWEVTDNVLKTLSTLSTSQSVKKQTNNDNEGSSATSTQGLELQTVPLIFTVVRGLGVDPYEEYTKWQSRLTKVNPLYVGTRRFGSLHMQLDSVGIAAIELDNAGNILTAEISLNFTESAEEASEAKTKGNAADYYLTIPRRNAPDYYLTIPREPLSGTEIAPSAADKAAKKTMELYLTPEGTWALRPNSNYSSMPGFEQRGYENAPIFQGPFK